MWHDNHESIKKNEFDAFIFSKKHIWNDWNAFEKEKIETPLKYEYLVCILRTLKLKRLKCSFIKADLDHKSIIWGALG